MMLTWHGERRVASGLTESGRAISEAVDLVLGNASDRTRDLGGKVSTDAFGRPVADAVAGETAVT